ncbi:MAG: D-aminoacylase [Nitrospirae bacterium]|nr:D-aminoacylase [Nitrospirota bacterium]
MKNKFDLIIKHGSIFDGKGGDPVIADIAVLDGNIFGIGTYRDDEAEAIVEARGMAVAPGFIDSHAHSDFTLIADRRAVGKILQGVTTEINGNCGMSAAPLYGKAAERREDDLKELGIIERWNSVRQYRELIEKKGLALNTAMLIGHGNIRGSVIGYDNRRPSEAELLQMKQLLDRSIQEGGIGLSTGLIYPPGIYSETDELVALSEVLKPYGLIYTSHMRSEGAALLESVQEVISIGQAADIKTHISHIKTAGQQNWHKADAAIALLMAAREQGVEISCDRYPYTASSTDLDSLLPAWVFEGGNEEELQRLHSKELLVTIRRELLDQVKDRAYWQRVIVSSVVSPSRSWMEGMTIADISQRLGCDEINAVFTLLREEKLRVGAIFLSMSGENLKTFLSLPFCTIGSDSSARCFDGPTRLGKPHPRTFGTFPRLFGTYVRDEKLMPLKEAVRRATMLPAALFGLRGRGQIKEGFAADIVIFDPDTITDKATFEDPYLKPSGIPYVLVNGIPAVWAGKPTGKCAGRMLKATGR